jgi:hypothetical protein
MGAKRLLQQPIPWVEASSMTILHAIDDRGHAAIEGGKLQFLQSYHVGRFAAYRLMLAGYRAAGNPWPACTLFFNRSASDRCLG